MHTTIPGGLFASVRDQADVLEVVGRFRAGKIPETVEVEPDPFLIIVADHTEITARTNLNLICTLPDVVAELTQAAPLSVPAPTPLGTPFFVSANTAILHFRSMNELTGALARVIMRLPSTALGASPSNPRIPAFEAYVCSGASRTQMFQVHYFSV
ncbi:hypothetical protein HDU93_003549 [Gonapodya sp. JEL0774]|nr:hypothetical protein HDU93_003549 [Gonapodya sp. JEL0774]